MNKLVVFTLAIFISIGVFAQESEPTLTISVSGKSKTFTRSELLKFKGLRAVHVKNDISYHRDMTYKHAVPVADLFKDLGVEPEMTVSFKCLDGFTAPIAQTRLFNRDPKGAVAFIAIEDPNAKWPQVGKSGPESAGPFYLVWLNPEKSNISIEEWPYQLKGFEANTKSVEELYPNVGVAKELSAKDPARKGYAAFMKNCFACHAMNGDGGDKIGPDLNLPESVVDYFQHDYFKKFIRSPQRLRTWKRSQMSSFDEKILPDAEIEQIWAYLTHMSTRKNSLR